MVLIYKPSVIDTPSGGAPGKAPRWDLVDTESYNGGISVLAPYLVVWGYVGIYRRKEYVGGATEGPRGRGRALGGRPHPRGPVVPPLTDFFCLYILIYPENIREHHETLFPPPQPSVPKRSHLGAFSGSPPEGESITEGLYINSMAPPMMCE